MKFYISFVIIVFGVYVYAMLTGYRVMSFKETTRSKEYSGMRTFYHK